MKAMSGPMPVIPGHPDIADRGFAAGREDVKPDKPGSTRAQRRKPALQPVVRVVSGRNFHQNCCELLLHLIIHTKRVVSA